ncbi:unnamed protein product [Rangifer tarandus platyrhynchus]|uniref:Uncharacterized protein n=1 Tax=Rangifer tarandus platyrhynchus TaxID=3082113 RepID=A0AC59ZYQ3_RANTA
MKGQVAVGCLRGAGRSRSGRADPRPPLDPSGQVGSTDVKPEQPNLVSYFALRSAKTLRARRAGGRPAPGPKALTVPGNATRDCDTPASGSPSSTSPDHRHPQFHPEKLHPPAWKLSPGNTLGKSQDSPPWFPTSLSVTSLLPDGKS